MELHTPISAHLAQLQADLHAELARVRTRIAELAIDYDSERTQLQAAMQGIREAARQTCDRARERSIQQAKRPAWRAAFSLAGPFGPGAPQVFCWFGLLLGCWLLAQLTGSLAVAAIATAAGYAALVRWGHGREALRLSRPEREAIEEFRGGLQPLLIAFHSEGTGDTEFPYKVTIGAATDDCGATTRYRIHEQKYGTQYGATFVGFGRDSRHVLLLARMALDGFKAQVLPFGEFKETDARWPHWSALAAEVASAATPIATQMRKMVDARSEIADEESRAALLEQRLATVSTVEKSWADVALDINTLDRILRLVDSFKSGRPIKGMLLHGPPGTGKTLIARKLAQHSGCHFIAAGIADLKSQNIGGSGPKVKEVWERARANAPTILFIDECESVFASRGSSQSDAFGAELVQTFLSEWDGFNQSSGQVLVIGATNRHELLDNAVMSRFTESIEIGLPDAEARLRILATEFAKAGLRIEPTEEMARETSGMSGRDIHTLVAKIVTHHVHGEITQEQFLEQARNLRGKQSTAVDRLGWDDLVLPEKTLADFKSLGRELVHAEELRGLGVDVPRGILLYGPPGTGKTQIARVLASESGLAFIAATSGDVKAGYIGQSGNLVKQLFARARSQAPCILFLDEIDTIAQARGSGDSFTNEVVSQLLQELDGVATRKGQVFLLAASNLPGNIDPALHSRFERKIEIGLPDEGARAAILALQLAGKPVDFDIDEACTEVAARTAGLSGRDLQSLANNATRRAVQRAIAEHGDPLKLSLARADLEAALASLEPATTEA